MRFEGYQFNHSSFLSVEKDTSIIVNKLLTNNRLKKLLYYSSRDALHKDNLTEQQTIDLMQNYIKLVPKLPVDSDVRAYIVLTFDTFTQNLNNPEFRDNFIYFDIICHYDQWQLEDFQLRPFRIAAEIDTMINKKHLTGIGELEFVGASKITVPEEFGGLTLVYRAIHGGDDKVRPLTKKEEELLFKND